MSLRWDQGRGTIEDMLAAGALEQVPDSREHADLPIAQAREHLASAKAIADSEPEGGYAMVYDAARKWLSAVLENQGLRTTSLRGHHQADYDAVFAQLEPPMGKDLRPFRRMKQNRGSAEYPSTMNLPSPRRTSSRTVPSVPTHRMISMRAPARGMSSSDAHETFTGP